MEGNVLTKVVMPLALGVIMLGLGLGLTGADFKRIMVMPRPVIVGLVCQTILLPVVCYAIAVGFGLPPELAVGLMLLAASPGGASANVFSHLAHGDVALNITLTATNSVLSLLTLPVLVGLSMKAFLGADKQIPLQTNKFIQVFAIILVPVAIGMFVRAKKPALSERLAKPVRSLAFIFLILVIGAAVYTEAAKEGGTQMLLTAFKQVGLAALVFNLTSLAVGYFVPLAFKMPKKQAVAIGMEIGIHNGTLAIAVATTVLKNSTMSIPAVVYSLIMFGTAAAFGTWVGRKVQAEETEKQAA
ncbi:MAG: bile acid:sodium symporter family protein [Polyangiaceae bacterium]|nr:bile acid:sodium symporter family protein [Polyangiaceae bacterium]